jgi:hypothetical protein
MLSYDKTIYKFLELFRTQTNFKKITVLGLMDEFGVSAIDARSKHDVFFVSLPRSILASLSRLTWLLNASVKTELPARL